MVFIPARYRDVRMLAADEYYDGNGPYFVDLSKDPTSERDSVSLPKEFEIVGFETFERVNQLSVTKVTVVLPHDFLADMSKHTNVKTAEDYFAAQMFKHVAIGWDRPDPTNVPTELFQLTTYFHGILTNVTFAAEPYGDVVVMELQPYLWRLTQKNHYRSFEAFNARELIEKVTEPYQKEVTSGKFQIRYEFGPTSKYTQIVQMGESDYEFLIRILEDAGLSYFCYSNKNTVILVITDNILLTYDKIEKEFSDLTKPLSFIAASDESAVGHIFEGPRMPLLHYAVNCDATPTRLVALSMPDYRSADATSAPVVFEKPALSDETFVPTRTELFQTTHHMSGVRHEREDAFQTESKNRFQREYSVGRTYTGYCRAYAFFPCWRRIEIEFGDKRARVYKSMLSQPKFFHALNVRQRFKRLPRFYLPPVSPHQTKKLFYNLEVDLTLVDGANDEMTPPFVMPAHLITRSVYAQRRHASRTFSAVVVDFKSDDKTEQDYDLTNMVRVRFHWHKSDESIRARFALPWTGDGYGFAFMPEVGSEVVVVFLNNDPDYPVIIGSCYNSKNKYPYSDAKKREVEGKFSARGILFKDGEAELVFEPIKDKSQTTQVFTIATTDGQLMLAGANIDANAKKTSVVRTTDGNSALSMDENGVVTLDSDGKSTLKLQKTGQMTAKAAEINMDGDAKIKAEASVITMNSLTLPG